MGSLDSIFTSAYGEQQWAHQISKNFDDKLAIDNRNITVSIFNVPKTVSDFKPEAYLPQVIALGPYHHFTPQLYQMERYKVDTVRSFLNFHQIVDFQKRLIEPLKQLEPTIRACYHKYLDIDENTLAWIIAIDGLFLLDLLHAYSDDFAGKKMTQNSTVCRDMVIMENQFPMILLKIIRKTLQLVVVDENNYDCELYKMLRDFCVTHSPLPLGRNKSELTPGTKIIHLHLLDLMYYLIANTRAVKVGSKESPPKKADIVVEVEMEKQDTILNVSEIVDVVLSSGIGGEALKPLQVINNLPWEKMSNLLGHKTVDKLDKINIPIVEKISVPSVTYLSNIAGVEFKPTGGIRDVEFDEKEGILYLPVITLNDNTEVMLRNLVAYEATISNSGLVLGDYMDLMGAIIDTAEDVTMLVTKGIIKGELTDEKIADFFNGMNKSSRKVGNMTMEKINEYFNKKPRVKMHRFWRKNVYESWKALTFLSTIFLLLLLILQSFCEVYGCPRFFARSN